MDDFRLQLDRIFTQILNVTIVDYKKNKTFSYLTFHVQSIPNDIMQ